MLCHCIGGSDRYWDRIQRHETYILFCARFQTLKCHTTPWKSNRMARCGKRTKFDRQNSDIADAK